MSASIAAVTTKNRYFSCPLDPAHAANAMRYVELNPVSARMVESVLDYLWLSARGHCDFDAPPAQIHINGWQLRYSEQQFAEVLGLGFWHSGDLDRLRQATRTGRPFGTPDFVGRLKERLERTLHPRKRGRKPKSEQDPQRPNKKTAEHC